MRGTMFSSTRYNPYHQFRNLTAAIGILLVLSTVALSGAASAQTVTRGPYLQMGTPTSMTVRWRTKKATDSILRYGPSPANRHLRTRIAGFRTEHEIKLTGLDPATSYYYSIGNSIGTLAGGGANYMFKTSPPVGTAQKTRIWVVGDSGTGSGRPGANGGADQVRNAYLNSPNLPYTNLFLMLGDNAYQNGTDSNYKRAVFKTYPTLLRQTPLFPSFGNHDGVASNSKDESGPYYDMFNLPRAGEIGGVPSGTEAYYSFDYANIHFVVLDSFESDRSANGRMMTWLRKDIAAHGQHWVIAYWHHSPYSHGSHNSDKSGASQAIQMREIALPILEKAGVDLVLTGHSHSYERSFMINGHYGRSRTFNRSKHMIDGGNGRVNGSGAYRKRASPAGRPSPGTIYAVVGSSGKLKARTLDHIVMSANFNLLGSLVIDIDGDTLDAAFLDNTGVKRDTFRIIKSSSLP
jgi:hypothetical protein